MAGSVLVPTWARPAAPNNPKPHFHPKPRAERPKRLAEQPKPPAEQPKLFNRLRAFRWAGVDLNRGVVVSGLVFLLVWGVVV